MLLELKKGVAYGPVNSRRLGKSLGVNLMPWRFKLCSFNCVYCHFGVTDKLSADTTGYINDLPSFDEVVAAVEKAVKTPLEFSYITFSGNGEPTLHPEFPELVEEVIRIRNRYRPGTKTALLSNSTGLVRREVTEVIGKIDVPVFKLDAGTERTFRAVNRPVKTIDLTRIIECLSSLDGIIIQTVFMDGVPSNVGDKELENYFRLIGQIRPLEVHIYSIDRPVPNTAISLVPPERLEEIARKGFKATGVPFKAFYK
jgi:wyosine [tRNA(Phe)-imidazoG37] synthetase (radical SAM superfamily)